MAFPFSKSGIFLIDNKNKEFVSNDVLKTIKNELIRAKAKGVTQKGRKIYFPGGLIRFINGPDFLSSISSGEIKVEEGDSSILILYDIKFTELMITALVLAPFLALVLMLTPVLTLYHKLLILLIFLVISICGTYVFNAVRFALVLRRIMARIKKNR